MPKYHQAASKVEHILQKADAVRFEVKSENPDVLLELDQDVSRLQSSFSRW